MKPSILLDYLPETVKVKGKEFSISSDFRTGIIFEKILNDNAIDNREKVENILDLYYGDKAPNDTQEAINAVLDFYACGNRKKPQSEGKQPYKPKQQQIYDYDFDADYIFAAFLTQYGIDLNEIEYMHWWKFQALFKSLESHNKIVEIMGYRSADLGKIKDKHEKSRIIKLKQIYALPENLTFEDKVARAGAAFGGMI